MCRHAQPSIACTQNVPAIGKCIGVMYCTLTLALTAATDDTSQLQSRAASLKADASHRPVAISASASAGASAGAGCSVHHLEVSMDVHYHPTPTGGVRGN